MFLTRVLLGSVVEVNSMLKERFTIPGMMTSSLPKFGNLRQVLFDIRAGNSNLAKSLSEKSNHAMYQDENPHKCLISL